MPGHEIPGCFPESACAACTAELARLQAVARAAEALVDEYPNVDLDDCASHSLQALIDALEEAVEARREERQS